MKQSDHLNALDFAELLTASKVARICTNLQKNEYDKTVEVRDLSPDEVFSIYLASNGLWQSLALDFDTKLGDAASDALTAQQRLSDLGIKSVVCDSGHGGRHLFVRFTYRQNAQVVNTVKNIAVRGLGSVDPTCLTVGEQMTIRPPMSAHRLGGFSKPLCGAGEAFEILNAGVSSQALQRAIGEAAIVDSPIVRLSEATLERIKFSPEKGHRSEYQYSVLARLISEGAGFNQILSIFRLNAVGERWRSRGAKEQELFREFLKLLNSDWHVSEDIEPGLNRWINSIPEDFFRGQAGTSNQLMVSEIVRIVKTFKTLEFKKSVREFSEATGLSIASVSRVLGRLESLSLISRYQNVSTRKSSTILLNTPKSRQDGTLNTHLGCVMNVSSCGFSLESLFINQSGPGKSAGLVFHSLSSDEPSTVKDLTEKSGKSEDTVRRALEVLEHYELAERSGKGWVLGAATVGEVEANLGLDDKREALKAKHQNERILRNAHLDYKPLQVTSTGTTFDKATGEVIKPSIIKYEKTTPEKPSKPINP